MPCAVQDAWLLARSRGVCACERNNSWHRQISGAGLLQIGRGNLFFFTSAKIKKGIKSTAFCDGGNVVLERRKKPAFMLLTLLGMPFILTFNEAAGCPSPTWMCAGVPFMLRSCFRRWALGPVGQCVGRRGTLGVGAGRHLVRGQCSLAGE